MTRGRWLAVAAVLLVVAVGLPLVRAVTGDTRATPGPPPAYDPPGMFATDRAVALPREADADPLPVLLQGLDAVIGLPDSLQVVDTRSGSIRRTVPALDEGAPAAPSASVQVTGTQPTLPVLATVGGRAAIVAAFDVSVAGHGTTLGHDAVELLAVDAAGYAPLARARIDLPVSLSGSDDLRSAQVLGSDGGLLVIVTRSGPDQVPATYAVDPVTGHVAWQAGGFAAAALVEHQVVGALQGSGDGLAADGSSQVEALGLADGRRTWTTAGPGSQSATVWPAGAGLVAAATTDAVTGARTLTMLDAATGAVRLAQPADGDVTCTYDQRSVTVCSSGESDQAWAAGYDAVTARELWQLPDAAAGRVAPQVSTAWHGLVYGTTQNGPVALDARTGADRPVSPGAAPALVDAYAGIVAASLATPRPVAVPATS